MALALRVPPALTLAFRIFGLPPALKRATQRVVASEWQLLRETVAQLRTDEGCRELLRRNPALANEFPGETLLLRVQPHGGRLPAALPDRPDLRRGSYQVQPQPVQ